MLRLIPSPPLKMDLNHPPLRFTVRSYKIEKGGSVNSNSLGAFGHVHVALTTIPVCHMHKP